jgi:FtsP/CotA-like multicopper oxidase with cupredoxin domain
MSALSTQKATAMKRLLPRLIAAVGWLLGASAHAAAPGITGNGGVATFNLTAGAAAITQPDGQMVYSWGYGCTAGSTPTFAPAGIPGARCDTTMQIPGPTLIGTEGAIVTVNLTNNLPPSLATPPFVSGTR